METIESFAHLHISASHDGVPMVFKWCSNGVPMVFQWCFNGAKMVFQWCSNGVSMVYSYFRSYYHLWSIIQW